MKPNKNPRGSSTYPEKHTEAIEEAERWERMDAVAALVVARLARQVHCELRVGPAIGRVVSIHGDVITLETCDHAKNFRKGMPVKADDDPFGMSPRSGTASVVSTNEDTGTVTLATPYHITGLCEGDYLFAAGSIEPQDWARTAYDTAEALEAERTRRRGTGEVK